MKRSQKRATYTFRKHKAVKGLATVALATVLLGTTVTTHAEETSTPQATADSSPQTPQELAEAMTSLNKDITDLKSDIADLKELSTPEAIKEQIDKKQAEVDSLTTETATLPESKETKTEELTSTKAKVAETAQSLVTATNELTQAQSKANHVATEVAELEKSVETKTLSVNTLTEQVTEASQKVDTLTTQLTAVETALNQDKSLSTKEAVDALKDEVSEKTEALKVTTTEITTVEDQITDIDSKLLETVRKVVLSPEYIENVKIVNDYSLSRETRDKAKVFLREEAKRINNLTRNDYLRVLSNSAPGQQYDINNLPKEVLLEVNEYALEIINDLRQQFGEKPVTLSNSSIDFAEKVADEYEAKNFTFSGINNLNKFGHSSVSVNTAGQYYNLPRTEDVTNETGRQYYELGHQLGTTKSRYTLSQLKLLAFMGIHKMVIAEDEWMHAGAILGIWSVEDRSEATKTYFGLSWSHTKDVLYGHYTQIQEDELANSTNFDTTYDNPNSKAKLEERREVLETQLGDLREKETTQTQELNETKALLELAEEGYLNKQNDDKLRERKTVIEGQLTEATTTKDNLVKDLETAQAELSNTQEELSDKEDLKRTLDEVVTTKDNIVSALTVKLNTLEKEVKSLEKEISEIELKIVTNKDKITELETEIEELKKLKEDVTNVPALIAQKEAELREKEDLLAKLKARQASLASTGAGTSGGNSADKDKATNGDNGHITRTETAAVLERRGTGEGYQAPVNLFAAYAATSPAPVTYSRVAKNSLPATGDASSMVALLAGTMAISLGVLGLKKRRP